MVRRGGGGGEVGKEGERIPAGLRVVWENEEERKEGCELGRRRKRDGQRDGERCVKTAFPRFRVQYV